MNWRTAPCKSETIGNVNRRDWLATSLGLATWPEILEAQQHAKAAAQSSSGHFAHFDAASAAEVEALTGEIIPTDDLPGAKEAGVVYFIDRALTTFDKENQQAYKTGLAEIAAKRTSLFPGSTSCAALTSPQRIELLKAVEQTRFFQLLRTHTMFGFLADPGYGGNRDGAGYKTMQYQPAHMYNSPFGFYDTPGNEGAK